MDLDHDAFMTAFERVAKRLVKPPYDHAATGKKYNSIPFLREQKYGELPETLEELIEDNLEDVAIANFITLLVVREMKTTWKKKHVGERFEFHPGNLAVKGNFGYDHAVLVVGDLIVGGMIEDTFECSPLLVGGSVRAKGMYIGSETKIAGALEVQELLHLRFTRGGDTLFVGGGAKTKLYVHTPHDSKMTGKLVAKHTVEAYPEPGDPELAKLCGLLTPALAKSLNTDEPEMTLLVKAVTKGTPLWR